MGILIDQETKVVIQGITGNEGLFHAERMLECGTHVVAGVSPGHGGEWVLKGKVPVFDSVQFAKDSTGVNTSVIFVPARFATDAIYESIEALISLIVIITEGIPIQDLLKIKHHLKNRETLLVGPNSPGLLSPNIANVGIIPHGLCKAGEVGVVSRSGTLTYEVLSILHKRGMGVSTCVGVGGDPIHGLGFVEILQMFEEDDLTERIVMVGEIGGREEEIAAQYISKNMTKPVVTFIAGITAPHGRRMGHAGAIIEGEAETAENKIITLRDAGVKVANYPEEIPDLFM